MPCLTNSHRIDSMLKNAPTSEHEQARLPYEPPAIEETSEFETLALNCGHEPGQGTPACDSYGGGEPSSG